MKNDLTCGVVRDLLPSYVENLLGEESKRMRWTGIWETCRKCRERKGGHGRLQPGRREETAEADVSEVGFSPRVRRGRLKKSPWRWCDGAAGVGGNLLKEFVIGRTPDAEAYQH